MAEVKAGAPTAETTAVPSATPVNTATREGPRPQLPPLLYQGWRLSLRRNRMGEAHRPDHRRQGQRHLRTERCRSSQRLVGDCHQYRGQQISARHAGHARARERSARPGDARGRDHPRLGFVARLFQDARRRRNFPRRAVAHPAAPVRRLQLAGLVQRGMRPHRARLRRPELALEPGQRASRVRRHRLQDAAVLGLLHQLGERLARFHPHSGQDRRHALQVGIRHRHQSFFAAFFH